MNFWHPTEVYFIFTVWSPPCGRGSAEEGQAASSLTADKCGSSGKPWLRGLIKGEEPPPRRSVPGSSWEGHLGRCCQGHGRASSSGGRAG